MPLRVMQAHTRAVNHKANGSIYSNSVTTNASKLICGACKQTWDVPVTTQTTKTYDDVSATAMSSV
eukprot:1161681-Pelagomonas_calceolata.AAC.2